MQVLNPSFEIVQAATYQEMLNIIEGAYRICYASEPKGDGEEFIRDKMKLKHYTPLEHCIVSVDFVFDRGCCYDNKTEILTYNGWKLFKNINIEKDTFLTLNTKTKEAEYQKATKYIEEPWDGVMIGGKSSMVDFLITPNHRMFHFPYDVRVDKEWKIKLAEEIFGKRVKFQRGLFVSWKGEKIKEEYKQQSNISFAKFMGIFITDGSFWKGKDTGGKIILSQTKEEGRNFIKQTLQELGWPYSEKDYGFNIHNTELYHFLNKYFPTKQRKQNCKVPLWIKNAPTDYINAFLDGVIIGDGNIHKKNGHIVIYGSNLALLNDFQECVLKVGFSSSIRKDDRRGMKKTLNNVTIKNNLIGYVLSITTRTNEHLFNKTNWYKENYRGYVYCVTVPNGVVYIRRSGKAMWSGNSHEAVRHRVASFSQQSTRYCNFSKDKFGKEIKVIAPIFFNQEDLPTKAVDLPVPVYNDTKNTWELASSETMLKVSKFDAWFIACLYAEYFYMLLLNMNAAAQEARSVLPNSLATKIRITANLREWRLIMQQRALGTTGKTHPSMVEVMLPLLKEFKFRYPVFFEDLITYK